MIPELTNRKDEVEALCRRLGVERLEVFGSAATGTFSREESDLDFLVEFDRAARTTGYADRFFELKESLEGLFGRPVDVVVASAIRNPYFLESLGRTRAVLYAA